MQQQQENWVQQQQQQKAGLLVGSVTLRRKERISMTLLSSIVGLLTPARWRKSGAAGTLALLLLVALTGCAVGRTQIPARIALLAPFEGRYREVGYDALYAARLAFSDSGRTDVEFFPIDDGGTVATAVDRARALAQDAQVRAVLVSGLAATDPAVLSAFGDLTVLVIGHWGTAAREGVFVLASADLPAALSVSARVEVTDAARLTSPVVGGEIFALSQFPRLRADTAGITVVSSARLPDEAFYTRYVNSAPFAPAPGLLAMLAYDAAALTIGAAQGRASRSQVRAGFAAQTYTGLNGEIRFEGGFWANAPVYRYGYRDGVLVAAP